MEDKLQTHIKEVIVVEGKDDESAVKRAVSCEIIITHGYGIREATWRRIAHAYETCGIIVLTDPDFAGEQIRRRISKRFPKAKHAFIRRPDATAAHDGDIGVENAEPQVIREALLKVRSIDERTEAERFSVQDMHAWGLIGTAEAAQRRTVLGNRLGIGVCSAKQFLARINHYGIARETIESMIASENFYEECTR